MVLHNITECLCSLCIVFAKPTHCFSYVSSLSVWLNASRNSELKIVLKPIVKGNQPKPRQYKYRMSPNVLSSASLSGQFFTLFYPSPSVPFRSLIQCFLNKVAVHWELQNLGLNFQHKSIKYSIQDRRNRKHHLFVWQPTWKYVIVLVKLVRQASFTILMVI